MQNTVIVAAPTSAPLSKRKKIFLALATLLTYIGIIVMIFMLFMLCIHFFKGTDTAKPVAKPAAQYLQDRGGDGVQDGSIDIGDSKVIKAKLQAQADKSNMFYKINVNPVFADGKSAGNLMLENTKGNPNLVQVDIIDDATGKTIYESPTLKPDQSIQTDALSTVLPKGTYKATAYFKCFEPVSKQMTGEAGMRITVTVLK